MTLKTKAITAMLALAIATPLIAADVATVNGKGIKQSLYDFISKEAGSRGQTVDANVKEMIVNKLISSELFYQEGQRLGIDKTPDYIAREELAKRELLVNAFIADYLKKNPISDADVKAEYDKRKAAMGDKEYSAKHILVGSEAEAKEIIAQLGKGGDFAKIAKEKSKDPGSKDKGGDLGWFSPAAMVKPFSDAVTGLKKGGVTQTPVQTQFGWHVIKLDDTRSSQPPAFDQVKERLTQQLQQVKMEKLLNDLKSKAKISIPGK